MNFEILTATADDLDAILALQKECYQVEGELYNDYNIPPLTQSIESVHNEFENGWLFLKVVHNNTIIATARGIIKEETAYIEKLAVKGEFQNQKFGQAILHEIEDKLKNCRRYELFTGYKSERNIYLYKKMGYTEFKKIVLNNNVTLVYLEKNNSCYQ